MNTLLGPSAYGCLFSQDPQSCNSVANLCVLQLYAVNSGACQIYRALVNTFTSNPDDAGSTSWRPPTGPLPWLYYVNTGYLTATDIEVKLRFKGKNYGSSPPYTSSLDFILVGYSIDGRYLGNRTLTTEFQICGADSRSAAKWRRVGWDYFQECWLDITGIMANTVNASTTVLYDMFLQQGPNSFYPVPTYVQNGYPPEDAPQQGYVRRFFYTDTSLSTLDSVGAGPQAVVYPNTFWITVTLRESPRGYIFPPTLVIGYSGRAILSSNSFDSEQQFSVRYVNEGDLNDRFWLAWRIILIVFLVCIGIPLWLFNMYIYLRRRRIGEGQTDMELIIYAVVQIIDCGAWALVCVLVVVTLYYMILYKLQESVFFFMLYNSMLRNFYITVVLAIVGQTIGLLWFLWKQTRYDIFFLDWEKERQFIGPDNRPVSASISCWRTLMIANEWCELQTIRVTYPPFTLIMMSMILIGTNSIAVADITPNAREYKHYTGTVNSWILRYGIELAYFMVLGLGQVLFRALIYNRWWANPVTQFVDLCYLSNHSVIILENGTQGYYIHGRNQAAHSDVSLAMLNLELNKEENAQVANRGLVTTYTEASKNEKQLFNIYLTSKQRDMYEKQLLREVEQASQRARQARSALDVYIKGFKAAQQALSVQRTLNEEFRKIIDDVERNHGKQVVDPTYLQRIIGFPADAFAEAALFAHDYFNSFTNVLFYGNELRLFTYETVFFCTVDLSLQNPTLTALLTFIMVYGIEWIMSGWKKRNISTKTMVDDRFLI